jgi:hypothetical protein
MTTLFKQILPIPEQVVGGTGSYTVPAGKYGYFRGTISGYMCNMPWTARFGDYTSSVLYAPGEPANYSNSGNFPNSPYFLEQLTQDSGEQWVVEGNSITVSLSSYAYRYDNIGTVNAWAEQIRHNYIAINGTPAVRVMFNIARFGKRGSNTYNFTSGYCNAVASWSVAIFAKPVNNLPDELKE